MNGNFQWPPLESDPEIFSQYAHHIGLDANTTFQELYSLDYKEMQVIECPVLAVIVSYERKTAAVLDDKLFKSFDSVPFYMKQNEALDNACGLIALLHSIGNNLTDVSSKSDGILSNILVSSLISYAVQVELGFRLKSKIC